MQKSRKLSYRMLKISNGILNPCVCVCEHMSVSVFERAKLHHVCTPTCRDYKSTLGIFLTGAATLFFGAGSPTEPGTRQLD